MYLNLDSNLLSIKFMANNPLLVHFILFIIFTDSFERANQTRVAKERAFRVNRSPLVYADQGPANTSSTERWTRRD